MLDNSDRITLWPHLVQYQPAVVTGDSVSQVCGGLGKHKQVCVGVSATGDSKLYSKSTTMKCGDALWLVFEG